jgi:molybdenum-dependent DNA-binding transcriptional regulator ModE
MQTTPEREAFAEKVVKDLVTAIEKNTSPGLGMVRKAWDLTADTNNEFLDTLLDYRKGKATQEQVVEAGKKLVEKWKRVDKAYLKKVEETIDEDLSLRSNTTR